MSTHLTTVYSMLPYRRQGDIDYAALDFDPNERELPPDHMEQRREIDEVMNLLTSWFTDFNRRPDVFLDGGTILCYDPNNLNVRVAPDVYLAFGVEAETIRPRKLYLPWEVGKPPDWVLEVASESTARVDVDRKPAVYAQIGVPEFWRFDPTGGDYYGAPLLGERLVAGAYQPIELTTGPDGILKGYSDALQLSLSWADGWPRFYNPVTRTYLSTWEDDKNALLAAEAARDAAEAENQRLREELRRLRPDG